jgi:two-component system, cell cycle sensor histidine kinase and response regulator CckA
MSAREGNEAISLYEQALKSGRPFDAVIMDLTIPGGMGGKDAVIKLLKIDPGVKAIVSSGYSDDPIMARYKDYGFCGVVSKPYTLKSLSETIHAVITRGAG